MHSFSIQSIIPNLVSLDPTVDRQQSHTDIKLYYRLEIEIINDKEINIVSELEVYKISTYSLFEIYI